MSGDINLMEQKLSSLRQRNEELDHEEREHAARLAREREKEALVATIARLEEQVAGAEAFVNRRSRFEAENPKLHYRGAPDRSIELPEGDWTEGETGLLTVVFGCAQWSKDEIAAFVGKLVRLPVPIRISVLHTIIGALIPPPEKPSQSPKDEIATDALTGVPLVGAPTPGSHNAVGAGSESFNRAVFSALGGLGGHAFGSFMDTAVDETLRRIRALPEAARAKAAREAIDALFRAVGSVQATLALPKEATRGFTDPIELDADAPSNAPGATSSLDMEKDDSDHLTPPPGAGFGSFEPLGDDPMLGDFAVDSEP